MNKKTKIFGILCVIVIILSNLHVNDFSMVDKSIAQEEDPTDQSRSNHNTQIKVPCPSNTMVNTWNGNLVCPLPIFSIPGLGIPIEIKLTYNSGWRNTTTPFGHGWQFNYNIYLPIEENGDLVFVRGGGGSDRYVKTNEGYLPPTDVHASLQENAPGKYLITTKYGIEYHFDNPIHKKITKIKDTNGNSITFLYDSDLQLSTITDASGRYVHLTYTDEKIIKIIDPSDRQYLFDYNNDNTLKRITNPMGNQINFGYNDDHFLTSITNQRGHTTSISYSDNATSSISDGIISRTFTYDKTNKITTLTDSTNQGTRKIYFNYDSDSRIMSVKNPLGNLASMNWDDQNNLLKYTDANNNQVKYTYDAEGNLLSVEDAEGQITSYEYENTYNKLVEITDANGHITQYDYDSKGNLIKTTDPLNFETVYTYDGQGNLNSKTDANGFTTNYNYNEYGYLTGYLDNSFSYNEIGNLITMSNSDVEVQYSYDSLNRVTGVDYETFGKTIQYEYDEIGNRIKMIDPDDGITNYVYDEINQLVSLTNPLDQVTSYEYDPFGRLVKKTLHNGISTYYTYDSANKLLSLINKDSADVVISSFSYQYDNAGNRISMTENNGDKTQYSYEDNYQLKKVIYPDGSTVHYSYDSVGNRLTMTNESGDVSYTYDNSNRLLNAGTITYDWDDNGNLINKIEESGTTSYGYDSENRLISITFPDGDSNSFKYYPLGGRLSKIDTTGEEIFYLYDGPNAILEMDSDGSTIAQYTTGLWIDDWISMHREGSSFFYLKDGLGSITELTDVNMDMVASYRYDVFGSIASSTGSITNPYLFTGREYDEESKLYYYRMRYYDAQVGRFNSKDPIQNNHPYVYVDNNPINMIDAFGLSGNTVGKYFLDKWLDIWNGYKRYLDGVNTPGTIENKIVETIGIIGKCNPNVVVLDTRKKYDSLEDMIDDMMKPPKKSPMEELWDLWNNNGDNPTDNTGGPGSGAKGPGGKPSSTGGGNDSGIESKPLLGLIFPLVTALTTSSSLTFSLDDIVSAEGPKGTHPISSSPKLVESGMTNAVDVASIDYVENNTGSTKAVVFATKTFDQVYEHDFSVCNKYFGYTLESASAISTPDILPGLSDIPWFWFLSTTKGNLIEEGFSFVVYVDEDKTTFTVDSKWLADKYPSPIPSEYEYVLNFWIKASNSKDAYNLLQNILENLLEYGDVKFANNKEPMPPTVLINSAEYSQNNIILTVHSWLPETVTVRFFGNMRHYTNDTEDDKNNSFEYEILLHPGTNIVEIPAKNMFDSLILTENQGFLDKIYMQVQKYLMVDYFSDSDPRNLLGGNSDIFGNSPISFSFVQDSLKIDYDVRSEGSYSGYITMLEQQDLTPYNTITFSIKGNNGGEKVKIGLVDQFENENKIIINKYLPKGIATEWQEVQIPLVAFSTIGDWTTITKLDFSFENIIGAESSSVFIDSIKFDYLDNIPIIIDNFNDMISENGIGGSYWVNSYGASVETAYDSANRYGSNGAGYKISYNGISETNYVFVSSDLMFLNASDYKTLSFQIKGAQGGERPNIYLSDGSTKGYVDIENYANVSTDWKKIEIPLKDFEKQGIDLSSIQYIQFSLEWEDSSGTIYLDDIIITKESTSTLRIDTFADNDPLNLLEGTSEIFFNQPNTINYQYLEGNLILIYNVTKQDSYAGYLTMLNNIDATPYNTLSLLIKGKSGEERVTIGLVDNQENEHTINIDKYLQKSITTEWQEVQIPLISFTEINNWNKINKLFFSFENAYNSEKGTIYLDNIQLVSIESPPIIIDNFNDKTEKNSIGGKYWTNTKGTSTIVTTYDPENTYGDYGNCYKISYDVTNPSDYVSLSTDLGSIDTNEYDTLTFYIKGKQGGEKPNIYLSDGANRGVLNLETYGYITTTWKKIELPLHEFQKQGVDTSKLQFFEIVFEWAKTNGTVYLDDLMITKQERNYLLVDSFSDEMVENELGENSIIFSENGTINFEYEKKNLKLNYNVEKTNSYAGYTTYLNQSDISVYDTLTFLIKGRNGNEICKTGFSDYLKSEHKILINKYLPKGITNNWQEVRIPLNAFSQIRDWKNIETLFFSFENNINCNTGTIYIDDIKLEVLENVPIIIDNFNDQTDENGIGGRYWSFADGTATIEKDYDKQNKYGTYGNCLKIIYSHITETERAMISTALKNLNVKGYDTLQFMIKGAKGSEKPKVYLVHGNLMKSVDVERYINISTDWQKVDIPLDDFVQQGAIITDIWYIQFVFEWEKMDGTIFIDDIQFIDSSSNQAPVALFSPNSDKAAINQQIVFDASDSYDYDGNIASYHWKLGDGTFAEGKVIKYTYQNYGTFTVLLTVTDDAGDKDTKELTFIVSKEEGIIPGFDIIMLLIGLFLIMIMKKRILG